MALLWIHVSWRQMTPVWSNHGQQSPDLTLWAETSGRMFGTLRIAEAIIAAGRPGEVVRLDAGAL